MGKKIMLVLIVLVSLPNEAWKKQKQMVGTKRYIRNKTKGKIKCKKKYKIPYIPHKGKSSRSSGQAINRVNGGSHEDMKDVRELLKKKDIKRK